MVPDSKVTIIIEGMERVTTISVPLAAKPEYATGSTFHISSGEPSEMRLGFDCYAIYDIDRNQTYTVTDKSRFEAEEDILMQANAIIERRFNEARLRVQLNDTGEKTWNQRVADGEI
jgi:hypothetical protein